MHTDLASAQSPYKSQLRLPGPPGSLPDSGHRNQASFFTKTDGASLWTVLTSGAATALAGIGGGALYLAVSIISPTAT